MRAGTGGSAARRGARARMTGDPLALFHEWVDGSEVALATATPDGRPSARMVLLKTADERGFTFFTNYDSRKGRELESNPRAALLFHRPGIQVRVEGPVARVPAAESDAYWETRPAASRRSAAASQQSQPIGSRAELEAAVARQPAEPPRPAGWGGFRLVPEAYEFWRHRDDRLHERHSFRRRGGGWEVVLLQP
ncbi:MAG TPA: pyridoxamine 5'-phosphate oxidase [Gaiellaceae bacterium]